MSRKVFISFLGTNDYVPVIYTMNGRPTTVGPVKYVQEALVREVCKGWGRGDAVMIFRTDKSNALNWLPRPDNAGLRDTLAAIGYPMQTNPGNDDAYLIPAGFTEAELWQIFTAVADKVQDRDEIYFDVTHAFRTIPLFATVLFNYCRAMLRSRVCAIHYGGFESLGSVSEVRAIEPERRVVPIVDMRSLVTLQEINEAASNFATYGTVGTIGFQVAETGNPDIDRNIRLMRNALGSLDFYMQTCNLRNLSAGRYMADLEESLRGLKQQGLNSAQLNLLDSIHDQLCDVGFSSTRGIRNVEAAIDWLIEFGMIQQALTMIREYVPTRLADKYEDLNPGLPDDVWVGCITTALMVGYDKLKKDANGATCIRLRKKYGDRLTGAFSALRNMRNDLNHASGNYSNINELSDWVYERWEDLKSCLYS